MLHRCILLAARRRPDFGRSHQFRVRRLGGEPHRTEAAFFLRLHAKRHAVLIRQTHGDLVQIRRKGYGRAEAQHVWSWRASTVRMVWTGTRLGSICGLFWPDKSKPPAMPATKTILVIGFKTAPYEELQPGNQPDIIWLFRAPPFGDRMRR
jgi:hypothetical protein